MPLNFDPPLLNSANPWCSSKTDLKALHSCPFTGAVTVRTSLLGQGFPQDDAIHQFCFFDADDEAHNKTKTPELSSSLNTFGYSPVPLHGYLDLICEVVDEAKQSSIGRLDKPWILSVTGSAENVAEMYLVMCRRQIQYSLHIPMLMEINLSCPNIAGKPPPAYDVAALQHYLHVLQTAVSARWASHRQKLDVGIKTPPYTHQGQFDALFDALKHCCDAAAGNSSLLMPITFITATNTLGGCLVLDCENDEPALNSAAGNGIGGLAGVSLHPLALGNVKTIRHMLDERPALKHIEIIGVGGVGDGAGYRRMRKVGASAVAVGTALGRRGIRVFEDIFKTKVLI